MSLEVSAFSRVTPMGCRPDATCPDSHWWIEPPPGFPRSLDGLRKGCYRVSGKQHSFFVGYSGYDDWRRDLSLMAHGVEPEVIWRRPAAYRGKAFVELIYFSDAQGAIGPIRSRKLAEDFDEHLAAARKYEKIECGFIEVYREFRKAFRVAAGQGVVLFH